MAVDLSANALHIFKTLYSKDGESVEQTFRRVANEYDKNDGLGDICYDLLIDNKWRCNTPVFFNAGVSRKIYSACFVGDLDDSMESIYNLVNVARRVFQAGSGIGIPIGNLRDKDAPIYETSTGIDPGTPKGFASGPVTFLDLFDAVGHTTKSGGRSRRAAILSAMLVSHPDIIEFIRSKEKKHKLSNMNISVAVTENFMECLNINIPFDLVSPTGAKKDSIDAEVIWSEIVKMAWKTGDPGIIFIDNVNKQNPLKSIVKIQVSNPCVTGDTLVATPNGYKLARDVTIKDEIVTVLGTGFVQNIEVHKDYPVYEVELSDGGIIKVTAAHQFHARKKDELTGQKRVCKYKYEQLKLEDLEVGDLIRVNQTHLPSNELDTFGLTDRDFGFIVGVLLGDGCITENSISRGRVKVSSSQDEPEWNNVLVENLKKVGYNNVVDRSINSKSVTFCINGNQNLLDIINNYGISGKSNEKYIPLSLINSNKDVLSGILDGLFSTDGNINLSSTHATIRLATSSRKMISSVRDVLLMFGIHCSMNKSKDDKRYSYINGREIIGGTKYDLTLVGNSVKLFYSEIGITHPYKRSKLEGALKYWKLTGNAWQAKILSIKPAGNEDVYDFYEPKSDTWITNGYVSRGCGEQFLPPWGACNLSHINVSKFTNEDGTYDFRALFETSKIVTRMMDNLLDIMEFPDPRFKETAEKYRFIGLGVMGLADTLFKLNLRYNSREGRDVAGEIMRTITHGSIRASAELAEERGVFPEYERVKEDLKEIVTRLISCDKDGPEVAVTLSMINKWGLRHASHTTIAPTGCLNENTLITTNKGILRFNEMMNGNDEGWCEINDLYNVMQEGNEYSQIDRGFINGVVNTKKIKMKSGIIIESTPDHKFRVIDSGEYLWRSSENLKPGDLLPYKIGGYNKKTNFKLKSIDIPSNITKYRGLERRRPGKINFPIEMNENLSYFMGVFLADGSVHERSIRITLHDEDTDIINKIMNNIRITFNIEPTWFKDKREKAGCVSINSTLLLEWMKSNNLLKEKTLNVSVPISIRSSSRKSIKAFIEGYIDGDGHRGKSVNICTISEIMAQDMSLIARSVGYNCRIETILNRLSSYGDKPIYRVWFQKYGSIDDDGCERYIQNEIKHKVNEVRSIIGDYTMMVDYIDTIEDSTCLTMDMHVPKENYYIANSYMSHNTCAISCDASYGMEPSFGLAFTKNVMDGSTMVFTNLIFELKYKDEPWYNQELLDKIVANKGSLKNLRGIPKDIRDVFVVAHDIRPRERIDMQAALQHHCSNAISSTCNLPNDVTVEEISEIFKYAYEKKLKGITVYRDGCKDQQPVTFGEKEVMVEDRPVKMKRPNKLDAKSYCIELTQGTLYPIASTYNGKLFEMFLQMGMSGQEVTGMVEWCGRLVSLALRHGVPVKDIVKQSIGIHAGEPNWFRFEEDDKKPAQLLGIPDAVGKLLERYYLTEEAYIPNGLICPKCGQKTMDMAEGCHTCRSCGFSKCS